MFATRAADLSDLDPIHGDGVLFRTNETIEKTDRVALPWIHQGEPDPCEPQHTFSVREQGDAPEKPPLEHPQMGIFSLSYILDKLGILSESSSYAESRDEIKKNDEETTTAHQKRLDEMKKALEKEKETERWGLSVKVFTWIGSILGLIAGVALVVTGVGAVAGAMLIAGSVISLGNHIMELTGGWKKVVELLPGDDAEKKRAIISWMQIGITILCLILSGVGIIFGGFSAFGEGMQTAMNLFGAAGTIGGGVSMIGMGINESAQTTYRAGQKFYETVLAKLKHLHEDAMEKIESCPEMLKQLFDSIAKNLDFLDEINQAFQSAWGRR